MKPNVKRFLDGEKLMVDRVEPPQERPINAVCLCNHDTFLSTIERWDSGVLTSFQAPTNHLSTLSSRPYGVPLPGHERGQNRYLAVTFTIILHLLIES